MLPLPSIVFRPRRTSELSFAKSPTRLINASRYLLCSGAEGAFDPTIQPLWLLHARHFSRDGADPAGPSARDMRKALALVGFDRVHFDRNRISLPQRGMALTLNGVAQGYVTDRIVALLRDAGVTSSLVDMGENRAIGANAQGAPWRIGLAQSEDATRPDMVLDIIDRAVATSAGAGFHFDSAGRSAISSIRAPACRQAVMPVFPSWPTMPPPPTPCRPPSA